MLLEKQIQHQDLQPLIIQNCKKKIISASVGFELQKALSLNNLPNINHDSLNEVIAP